MAVRAINRPGSQLLGANGRDDGPIVSFPPHTNAALLLLLYLQSFMRSSFYEIPVCMHPH